MQVRIGAAVDPDSVSAQQLREQVVTMKEGLPPEVVNRYALAA
jgi:hypothetical protein